MAIIRVNEAPHVVRMQGGQERAVSRAGGRVAQPRGFDFAVGEFESALSLAFQEMGKF